MIIYEYPKCSTCRKALTFLRERGLATESRDITTGPPPRAELERLYRLSGLPLRRWFNTSGESYKAGAFSERLPTLSEAQALDALAADGKLIKRPVLVRGDTVLVGFDEAAWTAALGQ